MARRRLILITGMSGSGKTTLAEFFDEKRYRVIAMGDVIRNLAKKMELEPTQIVMGKLAEKVRRDGGDAAVAYECIEMIKDEPDGKIAIDGIRSLDEVDAFKAEFDATLVAVHASPKTRFERLRARGRSDDPDDFNSFMLRDRRELSFGLGSAIAMADYLIVNERGIPEFRREMEKMLEYLG